MDMRFLFDPDSLFIRVTAQVVIQAALVLNALALGYATALGYWRASGLLALLMLATLLLSRIALALIVDAARRVSHQQVVEWALDVWRRERTAVLQPRPDALPESPSPVVTRTQVEARPATTTPSEPVARPPRPAEPVPEEGPRSVGHRSL